MTGDDDHSKGRSDPFARTFLAAVAIIFVVGVALGAHALMTEETSQTASAAKTPASSFTPLLDRVRNEIKAGIDQLAGLSDEVPSQARNPAPMQTQAPKPQAAQNTAPPGIQPGNPARVYAAIAPPNGPQVTAIPVGGKWAYDVFFGPDWRSTGQLLYTTSRQSENSELVGANMSWRPHGGQTTTWTLGILEADHPSHANTRFPGFFVYPVYLPRSPQPGSLLVWEIPWQGSGKQAMRRFDMRVAGWESVSVPAGVFNAVHLEGKLRYVDNEIVKAEIRYELWYAPEIRQIVRVLWLGRAPDESSSEMIAELSTYLAP